jgi:hypothetical protein
MGWRKLLYKLADEQDKARARELIGPERLAVLLAQAALEGTGERLDAEEIGKLLGLSKSGAVKRLRKNRQPPPRQ